MAIRLPQDIRDALGRENTAALAALLIKSLAVAGPIIEGGPNPLEIESDRVWHAPGVVSFTILDTLTGDQMEITVRPAPPPPGRRDGSW